MMADWVRLATLVLSAASVAAAVGALVVTLQIKNAILEERDRMKEWVRSEIRTAVQGWTS